MSTVSARIHYCAFSTRKCHRCIEHTASQLGSGDLVYCSVKSAWFICAPDCRNLARLAVVLDRNRTNALPDRDVDDKWRDARAYYRHVMSANCAELYEISSSDQSMLEDLYRVWSQLRGDKFLVVETIRLSISAVMMRYTYPRSRR